MADKADFENGRTPTLKILWHRPWIRSYGVSYQSSAYMPNYILIPTEKQTFCWWHTNVWAKRSASSGRLLIQVELIKLVLTFFDLEMFSIQQCW